MKVERVGLEKIKTVKNQVYKFRTKTLHGALMELSRLNQEKERLRAEVEILERRIKQIGNRLKEIGETEEWLYTFIRVSEEKQASLPTNGKKSPEISQDLSEMTIRY
ncbi:MAG: DUF5320 domain-containing protein [Candidatus Tectomicrobia bacterium]|nr:DUF5320 domain-containing protein [Candidatus Tectomicrobia bacterium]